MNVNLCSIKEYCDVCMQRKSEIELRSMISQKKKDVELQRKVQQLECEKQAVDVCAICACQN